MFWKLKCPFSVTGRFPNNAQASEGQLLNKPNHSYKVLLPEGTLETFEAESSKLNTLSLRSQAHGKQLTHLTTWQHPENPAPISTHQCKMTSKMKLIGQFYLIPWLYRLGTLSYYLFKVKSREKTRLLCSMFFQSLHPEQMGKQAFLSHIPVVHSSHKSLQTLKAYSSCRCDSDVILTSLFWATVLLLFHSGTTHTSGKKHQNKI